LSGIDSNLDVDPAPDRAIVNPAGIANTSSLVTPLLRTCPSFDEDVGQADFNVPSHVFSSHPRVIQLRVAI